jgi:hypothetical protein
MIDLVKLGHYPNVACVGRYNLLADRMLIGRAYCRCFSSSFSDCFLSSRPFTRIFILALRLRLALALSPLISDMYSPQC